MVSIMHILIIDFITYAASYKSGVHLVTYSSDHIVPNVAAIECKSMLYYVVNYIL